MPKQRRNVPLQFYGTMIDSMAQKNPKRELSENAIIARLRKFGLDPYEVELLMLRFVEQKTVKDIVKEQGWTNVNSANYFLRRVLTKLRKAGFKFK
jgi:hypothetical protein